jgi:hypothetical protein
MARPYYALETLAPANSVGFLLKRCGVLMQQVAEARFASLPISFTQWMTLAVMAISTERRQAQNGKRLVVELLNKLVEPFAAREIDTLIVMLQRLLLHLQDIAQVRPIVSVPVPAGRAAAVRHKSKLTGGA